ncbi:DEAD/DEAH box helicase [Candidatus Marimicrobium litorale]|uniref:ATP-dependent RNA helicase DeaD n=1 Tax=Candidatus Marimicrobium litorale TaxID=2518991 RepID=A0ABT3T9X5_9GAMM|nr:DEAD/DEAH box helicase [Candidatus Marimicrobium litorale]MCX2978635.1 DEAD/DEAH box helicase [Candidatus Marimicrobium litorale]
MTTESLTTSFAQLALPAPLQKALVDVGYETPSPIQARIIPHMLEGADVLGQAQTGTGKTAAFALPILASLNIKEKLPQVLVLAPTRELAIQVAEAFQKYAKHMKGFHVLPVYGGSDYRAQLRQLQRGVQVVVGTPGRVMDHMRRSSLDLSGLKTLVLDEADEMLRMGFIDDVQWILEQTPEDRQIALFSATMPEAIRRIAKRHLREPREVAIKVKAISTPLIRQRVWMMAGVHKLDALTRILEVEDFDGMLIFVRTRIQTTELTDKLAARGHSVAALNGDIPQKQREQTVDRLKKGKLDIVVATDVAARGLDVKRVSHVINYDIPSDVESYIHRIGRTGRAGRTGDAILFAANRERRLLRAIEKSTGNAIEKMELPTAEQVTNKRMGQFKQRITETLDTADLELFRKLVDEYQNEYGVPVIEIAAALGALAQGKKPLQDKTPSAQKVEKQREKSEGGPTKERLERNRGSKKNEREQQTQRNTPTQKPKKSRGKSDAPEIGMERFRLEVGETHGVKPANIVGAIANEAEIDSEYIGRIEILEDYSIVDLPEGMPKSLFKHLKSVWVSGQKLQISKLDTTPTSPRRKKQRKPNANNKKLVEKK